MGILEEMHTFRSSRVFFASEGNGGKTRNKNRQRVKERYHHRREKSVVVFMAKTEMQKMGSLSDRREGNGLRALEGGC